MNNNILKQQVDGENGIETHFDLVEFCPTSGAFKALVDGWFDYPL